MKAYSLLAWAVNVLAGSIGWCEFAAGTVERIVAWKEDTSCEPAPANESQAEQGNASLRYTLDPGAS